MLFSKNSKTAVFSVGSVNLHGSRINVLTSMLFYYSNDDTLTAEIVSTRGK